MIYRIRCGKDTTITNYRRFNVAMTGSNSGLSETLQIFRVAPISSSVAYITGSSARILAEFDLSAYCALTASGEIPSVSSLFYLKLKNQEHANTLPSSYDIEIERLARQWDEGRGLDLERYADKYVANWDKARSNVWWTTPGSDVTGSLIATQHFDYGDEDLDCNVSSLVNSWLSGGIPNNGFLIHLSSTLETGSSDYYIKQFHSRHTHFKDNAPYLEARWDDSIRDDRSNFIFDNTGSLYLYNIIRGQLTNIIGVGTGNNVMTVKINDLSGTIKTVSASFTGLTGIYSASFAIVSSSYSGSLFSDRWYSGSTTFMTGNFTPSNNFSVPTLTQNKYIIHVTNLKNEYEQDEKVRFNLFARPVDYNPATVLTASSTIQGSIITKAYYKIINDRTKDVVIPFGTGSVETTRLSYNGNGNYFDFYMSSLSPGNVYRIVLLVQENNTRQIIDKSFKFKIVDNS